MSSYVHHQLLTQADFSSFCDVSETINCTQAYLSRYGSVFGVPVALGGVLFFALLIVLVGVTAAPGSPARDNAPGYIFALSTIGLAVVLYLGWASYFVLRTFCILCAITYGAVIAIFVISGGATSFPMTTLPSRARRDVRSFLTSPLALVIGLVLIVGAVAAFRTFPREAARPTVAAAPQFTPLSDGEKAKVAEWWAMQPKVDLPIQSGGAKVLVVKFNDYQCPACRLTHDSYKPILSKFALDGSLRYVVKQYPLESECNTGVPGGNHYASCEASAAMVMARARGTGDKMEEWIFSNLGPPQLTPEQVKAAAKSVGGIDDFDAQYPKALEEVRQDAALGNQLKVRSTPTFYVNGRMIPELVQPPVFEAILEAELKSTR